MRRKKSIINKFPNIMNIKFNIIRYFKILLKGKNEFVKVERNNFPLSYLFLSISVKYTGYFALLPVNLDLDTHLEQYPILNYDFILNNKGKTVSKNHPHTIFDKERMIYLLGLLSSIPANNKNSIVDDGYIAINSTIIRTHFKEYKNYLDYLIETGIIEILSSPTSSKSYKVGETSIRYKWTSEYENVEFKPIYYKKYDINKISPIQEFVYDRNSDSLIRNSLLDIPHLAYWYSQKKLFIDKNKARKYAYLLKEKRFREGWVTWEKNKKKPWKRKYPLTQYRAFLHNLASMEIHSYKAKLDTKVHRLHSVLTNMQKGFRNFITYNGEKLVSLDIKNSQPYLFCLLLNPEFWNMDSALNLKLSSLPNNIHRLISPTLSLMLGNFIQNISREELEEYIPKASRGEIYEYIMDISKEKFEEELSRENAKIMMLTVFFSENDFLLQPKAKLKKLFASLHPDIYKMIELIKSDNYKAFASILQAIESEIVLHRCCKRIWEESNQQIPFFTVHDSIVTTVGNEGFVKRIMEEELSICIGIAPTIKPEIWEEDRENNGLDKELLAQVNAQIVLESASQS